MEQLLAFGCKLLVVGRSGFRIRGTGEDQVADYQVGNGAAVRPRLGVDFTAQAQGAFPRLVARSGVSHQGRVQLVPHDDDGVIPELRGKGRGLVDHSQRDHDERIVFRDQETVPLQFFNDPFRVVYLAAQGRFFRGGGFFQRLLVGSQPLLPGLEEGIGLVRALLPAVGSAGLVEGAFQDFIRHGGQAVPVRTVGNNIHFTL